ncbi:hypothetical protein ACQKQD_12215 [Methylobacterium sp. NPDC080182]|uniref:hypothetical protein n=1 Tax=Methylobacterium sp. NPDC080182 TaxID=3390590 RepID=UPI003CFE8FAA
MRCGRSDLRVLACNGLCLSCANRQYEFEKGCNRKGKPPATFAPLQERVVAVQDAAGTVSFRLL